MDNWISIKGTMNIDNDGQKSKLKKILCKLCQQDGNFSREKINDMM